MSRYYLIPIAFWFGIRSGYNDQNHKDGDSIITPKYLIFFVSFTVIGLISRIYLLLAIAIMIHGYRLGSIQQYYNLPYRYYYAIFFLNGHTFILATWTLLVYLLVDSTYALIFLGIILLGVIYPIIMIVFSIFTKRSNEVNIDQANYDLYPQNQKKSNEEVLLQRYYENKYKKKWNSIIKNISYGLTVLFIYVLFLIIQPLELNNYQSTNRNRLELEFIIDNFSNTITLPVLVGFFGILTLVTAIRIWRD
jgi:hypothetical protein